MEPLYKSLEEAKITKHQVDEIILVGGSTRVPKMRSMLKEYFGRELNMQLNPDEAVAQGAAIQAGMLAGAQAVSSDEEIIKFQDITTLHVGIRVCGLDRNNRDDD